MNDYFDDFDNDFDEGDSMDGDSFEDSFDENLESEDLSNNDSGIKDEPAGDDICEDEFTANEAVIFGVAMGFAYEEGLEEAERRKLEKEMDDDRDQGDKHS